MYASVNYNIISSDNGLPPLRCQAIIWTNAGMLLVGPVGTSYSEIYIKIQQLSHKKMHLSMTYMQNGHHFVLVSMC